LTISKGSGDTSKLKAAAPKRDLKLTIFSYTYKQPQKPLELDSVEERAGKSTDIPD
jgi:hypothetical protein